MKYKYLIGLVVFCLSWISCGSDQKDNSSLVEINIRIPKDPQVISPFFPSAIGREIFHYSYLSLADYHPETLELYPILLEALPKSYIATLEGEELRAYDLVIKKDATWSDGQPIINKDYAFTINAVTHPLSNTNAWKPYFQFLKDVKLGEDNKKVTVYFDKNYMLSREVATTIPLLPQHIYDEKDYILNSETMGFPDDYESKDSLEMKLFDKLNASTNSALDVVQSGPYSLTAYESNQYIILNKIKNHWTENHQDNLFLKSNIDKVTFKIVPDEVTAITMAKEGAIDLMSMRNSQSFLDLKENDEFSKDWSFHIPQVNRYVYIGINNKNSILSDAKVRRAFAHLVDVDDIIENLESGLAVRTIGDFHPSKSYYNSSLKPIEYNIEKANSLLDEAGWLKNAESGMREKVMNGISTKLSIDMLITGSATSKNISLLMQEAADKVGIEFTPISKEFSLIKKENISNYNYDMTMLIAGQAEAPDDPYSKWHSDNAVPGTRNVTGYVNKEVDKLIEDLRAQTESEARAPIYKEIQKQLYDDQPVVFLYSPVDKIIISNKFKATTSSKRPGYFANTFELR